MSKMQSRIERIENAVPVPATEDEREEQRYQAELDAMTEDEKDDDLWLLLGLDPATRSHSREELAARGHTSYMSELESRLGMSLDEAVAEIIRYSEEQDRLSTGGKVQ